AGVLMCWNIDKIQGLISKLTGTEVFFSELYYLSQLPAELDVGETIMVAVMSLFLSFIATLYPAWRAAHLDPVEALRYE
ncbi:MAG: lipoprotein-releasing system transmembrane subunit LolC, partial [Alphaproteobacteria bacterium]|nr:lipoprotein-releasing system transmembrane subunit LolC [Alphaproteobacteria bacterium]